MDKRLIFQAYNSHNLDEVAIAFQRRTGTEPVCFVVRPEWNYWGSDTNKEKTVMSGLGMFAAVMVPLLLTMKEFQAIDEAWQERRASGQTRGSAWNPDAQERAPEPFRVPRYCSYCGRLFMADQEKLIIHCGAPACTTRHQEYIAMIAQEKQEAKDRVDAVRGNGNGSGKGKNDMPDFSLDNPSPNRIIETGWVYFIQAENGLVKIGRSDDLKKRFDGLLTMSPVRLYLRHAVAASNYVRAEAWLHSQFCRKRDHGEWFALSEDDMEWVQGLTDFSLDNV